MMFLAGRLRLGTKMKISGLIELGLLENQKHWQ